MWLTNHLGVMTAFLRQTMHLLIPPLFRCARQWWSLNLVDCILSGDFCPTCRFLGLTWQQKKEILGWRVGIAIFKQGVLEILIIRHGLLVGRFLPTLFEILWPYDFILITALGGIIIIITAKKLLLAVKLSTLYELSQSEDILNPSSATEKLKAHETWKRTD